MGKFKSKADLAFEKKLELALERRDWTAVQTVMHQYGCYLELVDMDVRLTKEEALERAKQNMLLHD